MTLPRVVALALALAMITLLAPGPHPAGAAPAMGARVPDRPGDRPMAVLQAKGSGVGCEAGTQRFAGPRPPGEPPWPPGAEPTPTPSLEPLPSDLPDAEGSPQADVELRRMQAVVPPPAEPSPSAALASSPPEEPAEAALISGIDVSHHNGDIDFERVRDAGYRFAYLKATQDNDFIDPMFATNLAQARQAGLLAGGYHFFDYTIDGREQADHFLDRLQAVGGLDDVLPPVVDVECWSPVGPSIHAVSAARLRDFVERVYERLGRTPVVYTSVLMWSEVVGNAEGFEDLTLWAACWDCEVPPSIAAGWDDWTFWQTGIDRIRGVGSLDGNFFSGTPEDLAALRLRPLAIEDGALATNRQEVALDLGGREATHLRTSPDGKSWTRWSPIRGTPRAQLGSREEGVAELHVQLRNGPSLKSPVFRDSIVIDLTGPSLSEPRVTLGLGPLQGVPPADGTADGAMVPIDVSWDARDEVAGLGSTTVTVACGDARPTHHQGSSAAPPGVTAAVSVPAALPSDVSCALTAIGRDAAGNATRVAGPSLEVRFMAASTGERPNVTIEAAQAAIVARRGPDQGSLTVLVDGERVARVDLVAPDAGPAEVVAVADLEPGAPRTVSLELTSATIDGFLTLSRQ